MNIKPGNKPFRIQDIEYKKLGKECIIYSPDNKNVHVLNVTGSLIWHLSDGTHTISQICTKVRDRFDLPENVDVYKDVKKILSQLLKLNLVEIQC
jgi:hypothetical protein